MSTSTSPAPTRAARASRRAACPPTTMASATPGPARPLQQAGNDDYSAAAEKTYHVNTEKADQTIAISKRRTATKVFNTSFTVAASASSGLAGHATAPRASAATSAHLHDDERHRHLHRPLQPGRQRQLQRRGREDPGRHHREGRPDDHDQQGRTATKVFNASFTVAASASSGLAVSYSAAGVCSNVGATFTMTSGTGTCTVHYNQAGNDDYNAAPEKTQDVTTEKADQTIAIRQASAPRPRSSAPPSRSPPAPAPASRSATAPRASAATSAPPSR